MKRKNFVQKLKTSLIGLVLICSPDFNANTQLLTARTLLEPDYDIKSSNINYTPKYNTIAHKILMIEDSTDNIPFNTCPSVKTLDSLINNSGKYIEKKENYSKEELKKISGKIYLGINELNEVRNRKDLCYRGALIYLAIGEANKIPFKIIDIPEGNHVFMKYAPIDKESINIELTTGEIQENQNGKYSDNYYINEFAITKNSLEKNTSLKKLNEKEILSLAYVQIAVNYLKKNTKNQENLFDPWIKKSIENCNKAIKLDSTSQSAYLALGIAESMKEEFPVSYKSHKKAIKCFEKALKINPSANIYYLIANSYRELSQRKKAIENYTNSLNLVYELRKEFNKSGNYLKDLEIKCLFWRAHMHKILGEDNPAEKDKNMANKIAKIYGF